MSNMFNLSAAGFDPDLFYALNSLANGLLLLVTLPAVFLNVTCVLALALAKDLILQIKVALINVFVVDVVSSVMLCVLLLSYPIGAYSSPGPAQDYLCSITSSFAMLSFQAAILILVYATIVVYVFLKCGASRLKCYVTVLCLTFVWTVSILMGVVVSIGNPLNVSNSGFCSTSPEGNSLFRIVPIAFMFFIEAPICSCLTIIFSILAYCYVKRNTLERNTAIKQAMVKILAFHSIKVVVLVLRSLVVSATAALFFSGGNQIAVFLFVYYLSVLLLLCVNVFLSPIASLVTLKPLRKALQQLCKRVCSFCCRKRNVHQSSMRPSAMTVPSRTARDASANFARSITQIVQVTEL